MYSLCGSSPEEQSCTDRNAYNIRTVAWETAFKFNVSFTNTLYIIILTKWSSYMGSLPDHSWPHSHASHYCPAACLSPWVLVVLNVGSYLYWKRGEGRRERERVKGMEGGRGWWEENIDTAVVTVWCLYSKVVHPTFRSLMAQPMEMKGQ